MRARPEPRVRLRPMSEEEFRAAVDQGIARHAADRIRRGWWSARAARSASRQDFAQLLPNGRKTRHRHFLAVTDARTGARVGETWYLAERKGGRPQFWIDWLWIDPEHRRRGYARAVLRQLAEEAARRGAPRVGLHVLADNRPALALYAQLGYRPTAHHLALPVGPTRSRRPSAGRRGSRAPGPPRSRRRARASRSRS